MSKMRLLLYIFVACLIVIVVRLFFIQILFASSYSVDYTVTEKIEAERGKILDRNLDPLAINQTKYLLYVKPQEMKNKEELVAKIDEALHLGEATIEARINETKEWAAVANSVDKKMKEKIQELSLPGVGFEPQRERFYPEASLAAHLIGFVGKDENGRQLGYFGVEGYYDRDLAGLSGVLKSERDLFGRPIFSGDQEKVAAQDGRTVVLTIDKAVQLIIKKNLKNAVEQYKAKAGCVIAVTPKTMEIVGLSCLPDFDPTTYFDSSEDVFIDWAISSGYEPGSTFKPLVMAAAINEDLFEPNDIYNESGPVEVGGYSIHNWNDKYDGKIDIARILEKSSNVGMTYVGGKLGKEKLYKYLKNYGFGDYTNIDLQGESTAELRPIESWYAIDTATHSFGQGISVTAIQLVRAFSSIINGGYLMRPYIVKAVVDDTGTKVREPQIQRQVIDKRTSAIMRKMLVSTVAHAEAKWDIPKGFTFGGKTGTAQIALGGKYDTSKTIASFIGFAPADDPKFLVLVVLREPGVSSWGSETAAPLFFEIAKELLVYYNIPPDH